jgi:hypothetical protein
MFKPPSAHPVPLPTTEAHILMRPGGSVHDLEFDVQAKVPSHLRRPQLRQSDIHARFKLLPYLRAQHRITVLLEALEEVKQRLAVAGIQRVERRLRLQRLAAVRVDRLGKTRGTAVVQEVLTVRHPP